MNKLREQYCDEINTPMGLDNVYDYVKWLETKLNKQVELLQFIQTAVVGQSEQLPCFLYQDERGIFIGYHGDTEVTDEWNEYLKTR